MKLLVLLFILKLYARINIFKVIVLQMKENHIEYLVQ